MLSELDRLALHQVREIRARNNDTWMDLLEIALIAAPQATRLIIRDIITKDKEVTAHMEGLLHE